jgi:hypothetical protein
MRLYPAVPRARRDLVFAPLLAVVAATIDLAGGVDWSYAAPALIGGAIGAVVASVVTRHRFAAAEVLGPAPAHRVSRLDVLVEPVALVVVVTFALLYDGVGMASSVVAVVFLPLTWARYRHLVAAEARHGRLLEDFRRLGLWRESRDGTPGLP